MLLGFFYPYIIIPDIELKGTELSYIMRHELTHYKHLDLFYKWLIQVTVCLHWFNPFSYLLAREINKCCELSCDESIIRTMNKDEKMSYGDTLLNSLKVMGHYNEKSAAITLILTTMLCISAAAVGSYAAPSTATPWEVIGKIGHPYTYMQAGYYQGAYIFELGWNLNEESYNSYIHKAELKLSDGTAITVSFDQSCKNEAQDQVVLTDLTKLIERLKPQYSDSSAPLEKPLIVSMKYVDTNELVKLAEEYYINDDLTAFSAIFSSLDHDMQTEYCTKMIADKKNAFLSSTAQNMASDMIDFCLEKTYPEGEIALFSGIVSSLTAEEKQAWIARASLDSKSTFLAVLTYDDINKLPQ